MSLTLLGEVHNGFFSFINQKAPTILKCDQSR
jgi:hypothetical protein